MGLVTSVTQRRATLASFLILTELRHSNSIHTLNRCSHLIFLSHAVNELHHFNEVVAAEGMIHNMGGKRFVLPVSPFPQRQLSGNWCLVGNFLLQDVK